MHFLKNHYIPGSSAGKESVCNARDPSLIPGSGSSPGEGRGYTPVFMGFPGGSDGKESTCNARDLGSIPGLGRSPAGGHSNPLQYSSLENPQGQSESGGLQSMGVAKSQTRLSNSAHTYPKSYLISRCYLAKLDCNFCGFLYAFIDQGETIAQFNNKF